jgi:ribosomal protein S18 acetylase RimI-like enzyme
VIIRRAGDGDLETLRELWLAFEREVPPPEYQDADLDAELREIDAIVRSEVALLAEDDRGAIGFALARRRGARVARLTDLYVVPHARRDRVAKALVREVVAAFASDGVEFLDLEVLAGNLEARAVYGAWGFRDESLVLVAPVADLVERLR